MQKVLQYPLVSLGQEMGYLVAEMQRKNMAPLELNAASALASMAAICQGLVDIERPYGGLMPCSLYQIALAESGERKSTCDGYFMDAIREHDREASQKYEEEELKYRAAKEVSDTLLRAAKNKLIKAVHDVEARKVASEIVADLVKSSPVEPKSKLLLFTDASIDAILLRLHGHNSTGTLLSDEGGIVLQGEAFRKLPQLNNLWDGRDLNIDRISRKSFNLNNARFSMSLMVQPAIFANFLRAKGPEARSNGFFSRVLFTRTATTIGTRFGGLYSANTSVAFLEFQKLQKDFLGQMVNDPSASRSRRVLRLSSQALVEWTNVVNYFESTMVYGNQYYHISDAGSKAAEQVLRVAAILHTWRYLRHNNLEIGVNEIHDAMALVDWYIYQYSQIFSLSADNDEFLRDKNELARWIWGRVNGMCNVAISVSEIYQYGPYRLRKKSKVEILLQALMQDKFIYFVAGEKGKKFIMLTDGRTVLV